MITDHDELYACLNDGQIAYLYRSDPKIPVKLIRQDDPPLDINPPLLERHWVFAANRAWHMMHRNATKAYFPS